MVGPARDLQPDASVLGELAGIAQEVEKGLPQFGQVGTHRANVFGAAKLEGVRILGHERLDRGRHIAGGLRDVDRLEVDGHPSRLDFRKIENVIDQLKQVLGRGKDLLQVGLHPFVPRILRLLEQHFAVADDRIHRRAQFMAHVGQESTFGFARLLRQGARLFRILDRILEVGGAFGHRLLQIGIPSGEAGLALADLVGHAGEGPPEIAHLIAALQQGRELPSGHLPRLQFRRSDGEMPQRTRHAVGNEADRPEEDKQTDPAHRAEPPSQGTHRNKKGGIGHIEHDLPAGERCGNPIDNALGPVRSAVGRLAGRCRLN